MRIGHTGKAQQIETPAIIPADMISTYGPYHGISLAIREDMPEVFQEVDEDLTHNHAQRIAIYSGETDEDSTYMDAILWRDFRNVLSLYLAKKSASTVLENSKSYAGTLPLFPLITFISGSGVLPPGTVRLLASDLRYLKSTSVGTQTMDEILWHRMLQENPDLADFYVHLSSTILDASRVGGLLLFF